ncbi:MAG: CoA-binding protein [Chloroflexota bacterium]|nr:CoA-binding protein [Chloroflexota bacterium]
MVDDNQLKEILLAAHTIATVGFSTSPDKPAYYVPEYLVAQGYQVIPVNPTTHEIMGMKSYPDLLAVPEKVDVVQIFRRSEDVPPIVAQAIRIGAKVVWMQEGIKNEPAARQAEAAGLIVVMDKCMMKNHRRLIGAKE